MEIPSDPIPSAQGLHLRRLRDLTEFEVADDNPDVRGWAVRGADGRQFGQVFELIVDVDALKVRYLDLQLDDSLGLDARDNHILLPIGVAALDEEADNVFVPSLTYESVVRYPPYNEIQITREYEQAMLHALNLGLPAASDPEADFYNQPSYDTATFYQRRRLK
ncbi:PRC-barrel domain-containing protein [Hymenobacter actinosclerus]|uniref:PRC-barrel domain-containing protein n=1 Tax=Hymenobacter actinosclerus TaxID=82805 RepID=A0A1I0IBT2_9BACT|nr:PRC-barrel domain-containing protein [Hymenobacter actinosclerus]SET94230.1 PRC-barrel domain-containing protein [Hymenobacter actinosclerus]